jgi:hypothetical protein
MAWDLGSRKNLFHIQGSKRHQILDPDPPHCTKLLSLHGYQAYHNMWTKAYNEKILNNTFLFLK